MTKELSDYIMAKLNNLWKNVSIQIYFTPDLFYDTPFIVHYKSSYDDQTIDVTLSWVSLNEMLFKNDVSSRRTIFELLTALGDKLSVNTYNKIKFLECSSIEELQVKLDLVAI